MSASKSDKPPRIKGLVKRCRSFKEDILSRLARNRSLGQDGHGHSPGVASPTGWSSEGVALLPGDIPGVEPHVSICHRLKEAHLTLQFVESLIQKNCIDLLGGSSNVMLDLMGCLLNDVKKASASDSAAYQSAISQVKTALSDFLTSVDVLLLKDECDEAQRELYFEKLLETLKTTREALVRLKNLVEAKENGHGSGKIPTVTSSPKKTPSTPVGFSDSKSFANILNTSNQTNLSGREERSKEANVNNKTEEKKPPLPPKLKQWTAKSFDTIDWSPSSSQGLQSSRNSSQSQLFPMRPTLYHSTKAPSTPCAPSSNSNSTSLLNQWLEQSSLTNAGQSSPLQQHPSNSTSQLSPRSHAHAQPLLSLSSSSSGSLLQHQTVFQSHQHHHSSKFYELSATSSHSHSQNWIDSTVYVGRSSGTSSHSNSSGVPPSATSKILHINGKKTRTFSDSYKLGSDDSLDKMLLVDESRSQSAATTHSQSLSLGSSLDNLLLVDAQSSQSGLSPNSAGGGGGNRISVSSCNTNSGQGLAGLSNYDPDTDNDADVFVSNDNPPKSRENNVAPTAMGEIDSPPPTLPEKQGKPRDFLLASPGKRSPAHQALSPGGLNPQRCPSPYDNVREGEEIDVASWHGTMGLSPTNLSTTSGGYPGSRPSLGGLSIGGFAQRQFMSYSESRNTLVGAFSGYENEEKPPLPPKKKHSLITAYVELMHNFDSHLYQHQHHHHHFHNHQNSFHYGHDHAPQQHTPLHHQFSLQAPLPTMYNNNNCNNQSDLSPQGLMPGSSSEKRASFANPATSPYHHYPSFCAPSNSELRMVSPASEDHYQFVDNQSLGVGRNSVSPSSSSDREIGLLNAAGAAAANNGKPPALPPKKCRAAFSANPSLSLSEQGDQPPSSFQVPGGGGSTVGVKQSASPPNSVVNTLNIPIAVSVPSIAAPALTPAHSFSGGESISLGSPQRSLDEESIDMYILDVGPMLVMNDGSTTIGKPSCDGPEVKGGEPHVLIVYAASPSLTDKKFREVFLLTYRNFVRPLDVVSLLWKRYQYFEKKTDRTSLIHGRATLDLFVDVVNSLTPMDLDQSMVSKVRDCIYYLVNNGEILNALKARKGLIVKYSVRVKLLCPKPTPVSLAITAEGQTLLQWSPTSIAQQMTLLDSELFRQLEPAELLLWAREQTEDLCPALNNFTEHFNKVSYWARSKVLTCVTSRERNRTMKKLIEVMRKLREYSNFNSLLAVLAALDSAPIRRLGFSRRLTEALKPHAALTDSSGSFRTYRLALSESKPPCIPYIGLVLQDLTFVHIGNVDFLADGKVNWIKRWQQWVVLEPIRRFHSCQYGFIRNDSLLAFLNNFDESLNDDDLWQLSEQIKPRSKN